MTPPPPISGGSPARIHRHDHTVRFPLIPWNWKWIAVTCVGVLVLLGTNWVSFMMGQDLLIKASVKALTIDTANRFNGMEKELADVRRDLENKVNLVSSNVVGLQATGTETQSQMNRIEMNQEAMRRSILDLGMAMRHQEKR